MVCRMSADKDIATDKTSRLTSELRRCGTASVLDLSRRSGLDTREVRRVLGAGCAKKQVEL